MANSKANRYTSINRIGDINDANYLNADFRNVLRSKKITENQNLIDELWGMGRAIAEAQLSGFGDRIGGINTYYLEAVKWIAGQAPTSNWSVITPLTNTLDSDTYLQTTRQFFQSWFPSFQNTFFANPVLTSYYFLNQKIRGQALLRQEVEVLNQKAGELSADLKAEGELQKEEIRQADSLREWQSYFDDLIKPKQRKWRPWSRYLGEDATNYFCQMRHHKLWKNIWLFIFVIAEVLLEVINSRYLHWTVKDNLAEIVSLKFSVGLLFGALYVGSNKNYRIYANLFDQTRFRSVVSKTVQGIILNDERFGSEYRNLLMTVAAQSLFEMRPNGHLTKKESVSPASELLTTLLSKQN